MRPEESFIGQPVRSLQTMLRVIGQVNLRIPTIIPDGIYGTTTQQAVVAFQRYCSIPATGVVNQLTWDRIVQEYEEASTEVFKAEPVEILIDKNEQFIPGQSGPYIFFAQTMLNTIFEGSLDPLPAMTGIMDDKTVASLKIFQEKAGLSPNGILNKETWKHIVLQFSAKIHTIKSIQDNDNSRN